MDGEAVCVAFPSSLDNGPGNWHDIHPALLSSYCDDQDIKLYTYKHANLEFAANPYVPGDRVIKRSHEDPDSAIVVGSRTEDNGGKILSRFQDNSVINLWPRIRFYLVRKTA